MIVGLFPELTAPGGVQRAGRLTAAAVAAFAADGGEPCEFLSLNDPPAASPFRVGEREIRFSGFERSKSSFLRAAWSAASRQPRLIFALHPNLAPAVAAMNLIAPSACTAVFAHGIEVWTPLPWLRRRALQLADVVFAPSADTVRRLHSQQGVVDDRAVRVPWSLGPEFTGSDTPGKLPGRLPDGFPDGRVILSVGRWDAREAYKGVDHLILSLPALLEHVPNLHLVAVGSGTDLPRLRRIAEDAGLTRSVHFLNSLSAEELAAAYDACDVFALPSRGEGFGLVFLEAMAHAKPVIGGAHGGTPDVIDDGVTGYLVPFGDQAQLADRLLRLLTDEPSRRAMGVRAFERVCRDYTFGSFSRNLARAMSALMPTPAVAPVVAQKRH